MTAMEHSARTASTAGGRSETGLPDVRGLLGPDDARRFALHRRAPSPDLAWCLEHHWAVEWDLPPGAEHRVDLLAHPSLNLSLTDDRLGVWGVATGVFVQVLSGRGRVYGATFRPGGSRPFLATDAAELTDLVVPAGDVWPSAAPLEATLQAEVSLAGRAAATEAFLRSLRVAPDPHVAVVGGWVDALLTDPSVRRVADLCDRAGISARALQRAFRRSVGVSPRWVLQRGRLHEVAQRIAADATCGGTRGWAELAADLGYVDQPHFIRDFRATVGRTPARYAQGWARPRCPQPA